VREREKKEKERTKRGQREKERERRTMKWAVLAKLELCCRSPL
jgi:hypothetical protein